MFAFKRPFTSVMAGLITVVIGLCLDMTFSSAWTSQHVAAVI